MDRRTFNRLARDGLVVAALPAMSGCSSELPSEAIAAWQGPANDSNVREWILSCAILAPHSHNLQSWVVDLRQPDEITLHCDPGRLLPETDPHSRQIMMSHGTFVELLDIAARTGDFAPTSSGSPRANSTPPESIGARLPAFACRQTAASKGTRCSRRS